MSMRHVSGRHFRTGQIIFTVAFFYIHVILLSFVYVFMSVHTCLKQQYPSGDDKVDLDYLTLFFAVIWGHRIPKARPDRVLHCGATWHNLLTCGYCHRCQKQACSKLQSSPCHSDQMQVEHVFSRLTSYACLPYERCMSGWIPNLTYWYCFSGGRFVWDHRKGEEEPLKFLRGDIRHACSTAW